jgi:hypothetical protein
MSLLARRSMSVLALAWLGSACGCVRWIGMPPLPTGSFNDTALYGVSNKKWGANVNRARKLMRQPEAGFDWRLAGTAGESLARFSEVREKFAGVIFVGDSQIREVSWAALKMLTPAEEIRYDEKDPVVGRKRASELGGSCVPQSVGKTGFTAECRAGVCRMHSPFHNKSHAEAMRKLLLTRPHDWDGSLSLTEAACSSDFFVSYQATWGAIPVKPLTLPRCMHPPTADDTFGVVGATGVRKPVLWVMDGGGLHEMEFCDARRWILPQVVLKHFGPAVLRRSVVWQPAGGGFMMRSSRRYKGECAAIEPEMVARLETQYLDTLGVQHYDYPALALQFAPLMFDAIHFTYYWVPRALTLVLALALALAPTPTPTLTPTLTPSLTPARTPALTPTRCRAPRPSPRWLASSPSSRCNTRSAGPCTCAARQRSSPRPSTRRERSPSGCHSGAAARSSRGRGASSLAALSRAKRWVRPPAAAPPQRLRPSQSPNI